MAEGTRVLVVDDEAKLRQLVRRYLEKENFVVIEAEGGKEALAIVEEKTPDLVLLDVMLPEGDGWTICRQLRKQGNIPIIMLTARGEEEDRLMGFELGADDYVVKPFSPKELVMRVKALLRRMGQHEGEQHLRFGELEISTGSRRVMLGGKELQLTPKEYQLLLLMTENPNRVFTREEMLEKVWGYDFYGDLRTVDTHIKNLREKFSEASAVRLIQTVWGVGYKFRYET